MDEKTGGGRTEGRETKIRKGEKKDKVRVKEKSKKEKG